MDFCKQTHLVQGKDHPIVLGFYLQSLKVGFSKPCYQLWLICPFVWG